MRQPIKFRLDQFTYSITLIAVILIACAGAPNRQACAQPVGFISTITEEYYTEWEHGNYHKALEMQKELIDSRPELANSRVYRYLRWISDRSELNFAIGNVDEAIADLEWITDEYTEPPFLLRLALLYRYRGRIDDYNRILDQAARQTNRWRFYTQEYNIVAIARIAELRGENPKQLLTSLYSALMKQVPDFTPGFIGAGDLSLRYKAYDLAEKYYASALKLEPQNQEALAGLAECYWKAGDPRVHEPLDKLLEIDPNAFRGVELKVELLLDRMEIDEAIETLDQAIAVNPTHLGLKALQAAAYFLDNDLDNMKLVQELALKFNSLCSDVYRIPGRIASRRYRFEEGVNFQRRALAANPDDNEARTLLALDLLRLGREKEGRTELEKTFKTDPYNVHVYNMLKLLDSLDAFVQIEREPFVLQLPKNERDVLARDAMALLLEESETYQKKYDIQLKTPIHVQIFDDHDDFMVRSLGLPGNTGFLGICFGQLITMDSPSARPKGTANWRSVLWHEFVHTITLQKTKHLMPRWLSEGISVYEETQKSPAWGQKMDIQYKALLDMNDLPGLADLDPFFTQPESPLHLMLGYFLAEEFVHFYIDAYGIASMNAALDRIGLGEETNDVLAEACGSEIHDLDRAYKNYLAERLAPYNNLPEIQLKPDKEPSILERIFKTRPSYEPWAEKSSPFTDAMREGKKYVGEKNWEEAERAFIQAYELFPDYQGDDSPLNNLVTIYERWDKRNKIIETLRQIIETDATALAECHRSIAFLYEDKNWEEIIRVADLALGIDPFDTGLRKSLAEAYRQSGNAAEALAAVRRLTELDPARKMDYRLQAIELLIQLQDWNEAKTETVALLEEYPHFWDAQRLLLTIVENGDTVH